MDMRPVLAIAALLLSATPAEACLPPPPGSVLPTFEQTVRTAYLFTPDIVEAVVTRTIRRNDESRRPGELRVVRVYKGNLRVGQRLPFYFNELWTSCDYAPPEMFATRGSRGLVMLSSPDKGPPGRFRGFEGAEFVAELRRQGFLNPTPAPAAP